MRILKTKTINPDTANIPVIPALERQEDHYEYEGGKMSRDWRADSVVKGPCCSFRGPKFATPTLRAFEGFLETKRGPYSVDIGVCTHTYTQMKIKLIVFFFLNSGDWFLKS